MRKIALLSLLLLGFAVDSSAIEKWGPTWSEVTGVRYHRAIMNRLPAIIKSVDGTDYIDRIVKIEPGQRTVRVQSATRKGFQGSNAEMKLDIAPCKRYYINSQFDNSVGPDWKPVVDYVDTIAGCKVEPAAKH